MDIKVLNVDGLNTDSGNSISRGAFGKIFGYQISEEPFVVKEVPLKTDEDKISILQEYFLTKLGYILGVGPKVGDYFGFDILMFSDCALFAMEPCLMIDDKNFYPDELYQALSILHKLHIMHQDIKPENIMFSPSLEKLVFIDYGLSKFIVE